MPPQACRSTSRPSAQPNIDPTVFGALSIADLRSLCVQHGIPSTGVRKTLERWLQELNTPPPTQVQNINEHEPAAPNKDEMVAQRQERPEFTDGQIQTIQQLIVDTVKQSAREIATELARAAVSTSSSLLAQRPALLVPGTAPEMTVPTNTAVANFASPFQDIPGQYIKDVQSDGAILQTGPSCRPSPMSCTPSNVGDLNADIQKSSSLSVAASTKQTYTSGANAVIVNFNFYKTLRSASAAKKLRNAGNRSAVR